MFSFIKYSLILLIAVLLGVWIYQDPGYALFAWQQWTVEMPLWLAIICIILLYFVITFLFRFIFALLTLPRQLRSWHKIYKQNRSTKLFFTGLSAYMSGEYKKARKLLMRGKKFSQMPILNYIFSAEAAQKQQQFPVCDDYLTEAQHFSKEQNSLLQIMNAEVLCERQQWQDAEVLLVKFLQETPKQPKAIALLTKVYLQQNDWDHLLQLLPKCKQIDHFSEEELISLETKIYKGLLENSIKENEEKLMLTWNLLPRKFKKDPALLLVFVRGLDFYGKSREAEIYLRKSIKNNWNDTLIASYGQINTDDPHRQLAFAESWLIIHPHNHHLLMTLGRLSEKNQIYGKARSYYQEALNLHPCLDYYFTLIKFAEKINDEQMAKYIYSQMLVYKEKHHF